MRWLLLLVIILFVVSIVATLGMLVTVAFGYDVISTGQLLACAAVACVLWTAGCVISDAC